MKQFTIFNQLTAMPKRLAMVLTVLFTLGVGSVWAAEYETPFTITSDAVVSDSKYKKYTYTDASSRDWIITYGGNNKSVGTNSNNRSNCKLSNYSKYAVSPVTTSSIASAFVSTTSLTDIGKISYSFNGGKNQTNTKVYLIYSSDNNTFSQISLSTGTQGATISSGTSYTFAKKTGYFGLLFVATNASGDWRIDDVNISFYKEKESTPTHTVTATSNNNNYGTVSVSGTTITASPKTGYTYANPAYEVTSGTAKVTQNGNTFTVTPSSDCSIQINFAEKVKNTYIDNVQGNSTQTLYDTHSAPSLTDKDPATTGTCEQQHWHFMGWVTEANKANLIDANIVKAGASVNANGTTYYAVWAKGETTGSGTTTTTFNAGVDNIATGKNGIKFTMSNTTGSSGYYQVYSGSAMTISSDNPITSFIITCTASGTSKYGPGNITFKTGDYSYSSYTGTWTGNATSIQSNNSTQQLRITKIVVTTSGGTTTTYSNYITSCTTPSEYTVTFNPNGHGTEPDAQTVTSGGYAQEPDDDPTETGYNFQGWYDNANCTGEPFDFANTPITDNITLYAKWEAIQNTITLNANGGSGNTASVKATYDSSTLNPSSITNPTKTGYTFGGWYSGEGGTGSLVINTSGKLQANVSGYTGANGVWKATTNKTLYAKWTPSVYTITYKDQGNATFSGTHESGNSTQHTYGTETTLKGATKTGYTFGGWYKEATCTNKVTSLGATEYTANITLYAQWTANTYTVKFDGNGSDGGSMTNQPFTYGQSQSLTANAYVRIGYAFKHWTINQDGTGTSYSNEQSVNNLTAEDKATVTLYAQWTPTYTVTWLVNGQVYNEGNPTTTAIDGVIEKIPKAPANNTLEDCGATIFMGWSETNIGSTPDDANLPTIYTSLSEIQTAYPSITGDKTFYAVFASAEGGNDYVQISSENDLVAGSKYLIVGNSSSIYKALPVDKATSLTSVNPSSSKISNPADELIWTLEGTVDKWKIRSTSNNKYLQINQGNLSFVNSTTLTFAVTVSSSKFTFTSSASSGNKILSYYHNGNCFNAYTSANTVYIYKQDVSYSNYVTQCCALAPATNLAVSGTTADRATLTWTAPSPTTGITKLQVRDENGIVKVDDLADNATTATITGLTECNEYKYYVVSVGEDCEVVSNTVTAQPFGDAKTVNYDYNGGSGSPESFTTSCDDDKREIILPVATRTGYTFEGWYDSEENKVGDAGATYDPATSPITLKAKWTETNYTLTHSGSNYIITENKTSIKSSETPFTLHYTCTGDYGLPATISITGGGKSWIEGTDYTWEVAANRQSAILVIKETVISANVTITINVATRYTVTFIHNDKGVFSGSEILEVLSSENTITLPTVTDVSCGFYDTFEGWIVANEDYTESTSKPAGTIYKGGANYTVNGDCTLRALYSKCEGDATQVYRKITSTAEVTDGTYILVANTATPLVYSGHTDGKDYGDCISGLTADGSDFSNSLPDGAVPVTVSVGVSGFSIHNGTKFIVAGTSTGVSDNASYWQLTDGNQVDSKTCPQGVLQPVNNTTYVLQKNNSLNRFKTYENTQSAHVFLYKLIDKCTKYYSTNPSCEKPVGVYIVYNANAVDASMSCSTQKRTYKVENEVNKYPQLASQLNFCTNATREGYTLVGWNTQENGQGTTYNINQNYYNLPVSGELNDEKWITLNLYAVWKQSVKFDLGNATGGTGVPDAIVENGECVLPEPTAEQLGTIPCAYEFYAWSETSVNATQSKPTVWMPGGTYTGSATTLYAVYRYAEGMGGSDTYYFTFNKSGKTYCITAKHNSYDRFVVAEQSTGLIFGLENGYLYYLDEGVKTFVYWEADGTTVTTTTIYPNNATQKTTFVAGDNGTTIVTPAISGRYLQMPSSYTDRAYYTNEGINPTLVEVEAATYTYATNPTCYTTANLHFMTNGGTLNYPTSYDETDYQELTPGTIVLLPTATFAGEWTFEGWKRGAPLESTTTKPYDPSFYPVTLNTTQFEVDDLGDIYFYAVYSKTNDDKQFDPVNGGTYKLFAIGADGTKTYMPVWTGTRGTPSGVTTCAETGDYTITPGTGTHAGQYQITCGEYTLGVVSGNTDLNANANTWWNIISSTSGKGTWRITVAGSTDDRALSWSFSTAKSFGNYAISNLNNPSQTIYRDMEIGECIYTEYTSTPENIPYITITGAPVKITSTNGERIYAPTTLHIEAHNFTGERIIHLSATNGFGVDPVQVRTNGQGAYSGDVKVYYEPTTDGDGQTITTSVLTASQTGGTNAEKISQTFAAIQGRNMPANFVIAAKWDGHWYALPANCTSSLSSTEGLLIEVNDMENPTMATSAPASAKFGLKSVYTSNSNNDRYEKNGANLVFVENVTEETPIANQTLYNGSETGIQVYAKYANYHTGNALRYEWTPTTTNLLDYTLTSAHTFTKTDGTPEEARTISLGNNGVFGTLLNDKSYNGEVRLLPATFYEPAPVQVLKWKANSVIVMYTGAETTATTKVGDNAQSAEQTLANQQLTHGIYELTTDQALTSNAGGVLKLNFGASTRVELEIPLIISGEVTASADAHDVVILENSKLTAAATKYSYKDVYVYGGAKLAIPDGAQLGVNNIILRAGGVATDGAGQNATYQYIYPQVELKGTLTSSVQNIRYEYVTDYDHWYHLVLPFDGSLASIHYPYEYYGDQVKLDNTGSWQIKRYDGATRATGNYDAWKDIEKDEPTVTTVTAGKGYIYWGAPKKITANDVYDRPTWGIQRITMLSAASETIAKATAAENANKTISGLSSYANVPDNSKKDNDQGWNLVGNPYMVNLTGLNSQSLQIGQLIHDTDASGNWTGKWEWDDTSEQTGLRYVTIPSDHFETYEAKPMTWFTESNPMIAGRSFFVQIAGAATDLVFDVTKKAALMPALLAENNDKPVDIETGIVLSNETLQDEVNFWIKDGKTNNYEYNADYPKTPNNNHFNIYGVHTNGDLSWVATSPEYAAESMPIGYQVPAAGTFTLSVSETYYSENLQALFVTDHEASPEVTTNLVDEDYTFYVNQAETNNTRFTVSIILKPEKENTPTGVDNINTKANQPIKFLYQDKIYILRNGMIYDTTGKQVITINK